MSGSLVGNWARWHWKDPGQAGPHPGRWHVIAKAGRTLNGTPAVVLACGRARTLPNEVQPEPTDDVCPECRTLDDMRGSYIPESVAAPEKVPVTARAVAKETS